MFNKKGVYSMNTIYHLLPFLVMLILFWFTYINISYGIKIRKLLHEDRTLSSCLSDTGKYFYTTVLIIYIVALIIFIITLILSVISGRLDTILTALNIFTILTLISCILFQQIIFVGHRQIIIGKIQLDYRKIKRVTFPKRNKLRFIYGQRTFETSLRFIDDFKLKKALQKTR